MKRVFIISALLICGLHTAFTQPRFTMQFTAGYSAPLGDLRGEFGQTRGDTLNADTATYYMKNGLNFGIYGKKAFGKKGNLRVVGSLTFNRFSQYKEYREESFEAITYKLNLLSVTIGGEWEMLTKGSKVNPFAGADLMLNFFSGSFRDETQSGTTDYTLQSETRYGVQAGGGLDFRLTYNIGAVAGIKYTIANLLGKSEGTDVGNTYALSDVRYGRKRTISYLQIYGGVSFYFGF